MSEVKLITEKQMFDICYTYDYHQNGKKADIAVLKLFNALPDAPQTTCETCEWKLDVERYETGCGEYHFWHDVTTCKEAEAKYCPYCGGLIVEAKEG